MPRRLPRLAVAVALVPGLLAAQPRRPAPDRFAGVDSVVTAAMQAWQVPGLAVAVTDRQGLRFARGYGVRRTGDPTPVDTTTLFAIGSASKAFTGATIALLADEGRLSLDDRVIQHLPWFQMWDPWVTREIRVRDLLLHRSGLERGELLWYGTTRSREAIVRAVRDLPPTTSFRSRFQYQNLMFITAGEVARAASGRSWDELVAERLFAPLGMRDASTSVRALDGRPNVASPHALLEGTVRPVPWRNIDNAGAAGSINAHVVDMARWVRLWLNDGVAGGRRVLSEAMVREAIRPQHVVDDPGLLAMVGNPPFPGYALGWFVYGHGGRRMVGHGGNIDGMSAMVGFLPDAGVGVVILANMNQSGVTVPMLYDLLDRAVGVAPRDYFGEARRAEAEFLARMPRPDTTRVTGTHPSRPLADYVGTYRHPLYGTATVRLAGDALTIAYDANPSATGTLVHDRYDTFAARLQDPMLGQATVTFRLGVGGTVEGMRFPLMGADDEWRREGAR